MKHYYVLVVLLFTFSNILSQEELCNTTEKPKDEVPITIQELSNLITQPNFYNSNHRYLDGLGSRGGRYSGGFLDTFLGETQVLFPYNGLPIKVNLTDTEISANDSNYMHWMTIAMGQEYMNVDMQWMMGIGAKETFSGTPWAGPPFNTNAELAYGPFEVELYTGLDRAISYPSFFPEYQTQLESALDITTSGIDVVGFMTNYFGPSTEPTELDEARVVSAYLMSVSNFYNIYNWFGYSKDLCWHKIIEAPADPYYALGAMTVTYNLGVFSGDPIAATMTKDNYAATMNNPIARDLLPEGNSFYRKHITKVIESIVERANLAATDTSIPLWDYEINWTMIERFFLGEGGTINLQGKGGLFKHFSTNNATVKQEVMTTLLAAFNILKGKAPSASANTISFRYDWLALLRTVKQHFSNDAFFIKPSVGDGNLRINAYSNVGGCCEEKPEIEIKTACLNEPTIFEVVDAVDTVTWKIRNFSGTEIYTSNSVLDSYIFTVSGNYVIEATITVNSVQTIVSEDISISIAPIANAISDYILCIQNGTETFDLTTKDIEIIGTQTIPDLNVTYYLSQNDADIDQNAITTPAVYTFIGNSQEIFTRIFITDSECFDTTSFTLYKNDVNPNIENEYAICNNGTNTTDVQIEITTGLFNSYSWLYLEALPLPTEIATSPSVVISTPGNYSLTVTNTIQGKLCSTTKNFVVSGVIPTAFPVTDYPICAAGNDMPKYNLTTKIPEVIGTQLGNNYIPTFHITQNDADLGSAEIINPEEYTFQGNQQKIFIRLSIKNKGCFATTSFMLLKTSINLTIQPEYSICLGNEDDDSVTIQLNPTDFDTFTWVHTDSNSIISNSALFETNTAGNYSVTVSKNSSTNTCGEVTKSFQVVSADSGTIQVSSEIQINNDIVAIVTGNNNPVTYALNNINGPYQNIPRFKQIEVGQHTLYIKTTSGCIYSTRVTISSDLVDNSLIIPLFFTPNGDAFNPTWKIKDPLAILPISTKIHIYNRFGKLLKTLTIGGNGWDGFYNGRSMPSNDYWYHFDYIKDGISKTRRGHFSLIRNSVP